MSVSSIVPASTLAMPTDFTATLSPDALMVYLTTRLNGLDEQINTIFNTEKQQQKVQSALRKLQSAVSELDQNAADGTAMDQAKLKDIQDALQELKNVDPELGAAVQQKLEKSGVLSADGSTPPTDGGAAPPGDPNAAGPTTGNGTPTGDGGNITGHVGTGNEADPNANGNTSPSTGPSTGASAPAAPNTQFSGTEVKATTTYLDGISKDIESSSQMNMIHLQSLMSARQTAIQLATNMISALGESSKAIAANIGR